MGSSQLDYRVPPRTPATKTRETPFSAVKLNCNGTHQAFTNLAPGSGTLAAADSGFEYRLTNLHIANSDTSGIAVALTDGSNIVWGPFTIPQASAIEFVFAPNKEPSLGGLRIGNAKQLCVSATSMTGSVQVMGYLVPALAD